MSREASLLKLGEHLDGTVQMSAAMDQGIRPGAYRIEATLYGWRYEDFANAERTELMKMGNPFLRGEAPASMRMTLTK
jgi:hypothetical protein